MNQKYSNLKLIFEKFTMFYRMTASTWSTLQEVQFIF